MDQSVTAILGMGVFGLFWGTLLTIVNKVFYVKDDPTIETVIEKLPGVNCGACGYAGCAAFGEAVVKENTDIALCTVSTPEARQDIATFLGREMSAPATQKVAMLHCNGTLQNVSQRSHYAGLPTCEAQHITGGGPSACTYGCLGLGDCVAVCPFDALSMSPDGIPVVDFDKCTACKKCVEKCPRSLFKILPIDQNVFIACSSHDSGPRSKKICKAACIGCGICAKMGDPETFVMQNQLAVVDYNQAQKADVEKLQIAIDKCPVKIIRKHF